MRSEIVFDSTLPRRLPSALRRCAWVHHSGPCSTGARTVEISGVVKEFLWTNPHSSFKVEVPDADGGEAKVWFIEMNAHVEPRSRRLEEEHHQSRRQGHRHGEPTA